MSAAIPTIAEASRLISARQLSPVELTRACLDRVHALDSRLNAFVHLTEERALAEARAAEAVIMAGGPMGSCTASRSVSRTSSTPRGSRQLAAPRFCRTTSPMPTRPAPKSWRRPARC